MCICICACIGVIKYIFPTTLYTDEFTPLLMIHVVDDELAYKDAIYMYNIL